MGAGLLLDPIGNSPETTRIFLCGNPAMIEEMVEALAAEGYREHSRRQAGQIHVERYW